jgi:hypothetical protein
MVKSCHGTDSAACSEERSPRREVRRPAWLYYFGKQGKAVSPTACCAMVGLLWEVVKTGSAKLYLKISSCPVCLSHSKIEARKKANCLIPAIFLSRLKTLLLASTDPRWC